MSHARAAELSRTLTIIYIIQGGMGVVWIVHHHSSAQPVAVLCRQVAVVPERARLIGSGEVVQERIAGSDRALVDKGSAIRPVRTMLEEPVPMLSVTAILSVNSCCRTQESRALRQCMALRGS